MGYFANAGRFLIDFFFGALIALLVLRVLLQWVRANFHNPICQFLYKATNPVLMPLRRLIPAWRKLDVAAVLLAYALSALKVWLVYRLAGQPLGAFGLLLMALADLVDFVLLAYLVLVVVRALLSFVQVDRANPLPPLVYQLTEPLLGPIRRRMPALGGLDLSPLVLWLAIMLVRILVIAPLLDFGMRIGQSA